MPPSLLRRIQATASEWLRPYFRGRIRWPAVVGCLLIAISEAQQNRLAVRPPQECDAHRQPVSRESRWHGHRRYEHQECVDRRDALLADKGRIGAVLDARGLVLDRLMHDGVEAIVSHDFHEIR